MRAAHPGRRFKTSDHEEPSGGAAGRPGYSNCETPRIMGLVVSALLKLRKLHYPRCNVASPPAVGREVSSPLSCEGKCARGLRGSRGRGFLKGRRVPSAPPGDLAEGSCPIGACFQRGSPSPWAQALGLHLSSCSRGMPRRNRGPESNLEIQTQNNVRMWGARDEAISAFYQTMPTPCVCS